jgi:hypothetical protein
MAPAGSERIGSACQSSHAAKGPTSVRSAVALPYNRTPAPPLSAGTATLSNTTDWYLPSPVVSRPVCMYARESGFDRAIVAAIVGQEVGNITDDLYSGGLSDARKRECVEAVWLPSQGNGTLHLALTDPM